MFIVGTGTRKIVKDSDLMQRVIDNLTAKLRTIYTSDLIVISGLAEGFDEALAKAAVVANVPFHAYVPNSGYGDYYWRNHSQTGKNRYSAFNLLLIHADKINYTASGIYTTRNGKSMHSNFARNIDMVDTADIVWAYDDGAIDGGTSHAVNYAKSKNVPIEYIRNV